MDKNQFGKISKLQIRAGKTHDNTVLKDVYFTSPFKVMEPFKEKDGSIRVMILSASAGIMEGDRQEISVFVEKGAELELLSQSYEKIHKMKNGCAKRKSDIVVEEKACFCYQPQPCIPFRDSAFENHTTVRLKDRSSKFYFNEILTCGRYAKEERFDYRFYHSIVEIYRESRLIYRDNTRYEPEKFDMEEIGMYESFSHLLNIFLSGTGMQDDFEKQIQQLMNGMDEVQGGMTKLMDGDWAIRAFGRRAQTLEQLSTNIENYWRRSNN